MTTSIMFCLKCEATWLGSWSQRCLCGDVGQPGRLPPRATPSGMGLTVTHFETLPDPDEGDAFWGLW